MAMVLIPKRPCVCGGEEENIGILTGSTRYDRFYKVACSECGRETAKHKTAEGAIEDWNRMGDREEENDGGLENGTGGR